VKRLRLCFPQTIRSRKLRRDSCFHYLYGYLRNGANPINLRLDIRGNELAVSPHAAFYIDKVVGLADSADALGDLLSLRADALKLLVCRLRFLFDLL